MSKYMLLTILQLVGLLVFFWFGLQSVRAHTDALGPLLMLVFVAFSLGFFTNVLWALLRTESRWRQRVRIAAGTLHKRGVTPRELDALISNNNETPQKPRWPLEDTPFEKRYMHDVPSTKGDKT